MPLRLGEPMGALLRAASPASNPPIVSWWRTMADEDGHYSFIVPHEAQLAAPPSSVMKRGDSLDYPIDAREKGIWDRDAERLRGLEIGRQLDPRGLLDR